MLLFHLLKKSRSTAKATPKAQPICSTPEPNNLDGRRDNLKKLKKRVKSLEENAKGQYDRIKELETRVAALEGSSVDHNETEATPVSHAFSSSEETNSFDAASEESRFESDDLNTKTKSANAINDTSSADFSSW